MHVNKHKSVGTHHCLALASPNQSAVHTKLEPLWRACSNLGKAEKRQITIDTITMFYNHQFWHPPLTHSTTKQQEKQEHESEEAFKVE